jgi:hypothetical protein
MFINSEMLHYSYVRRLLFRTHPLPILVGNLTVLQQGDMDKNGCFVHVTEDLYSGPMV